jgi:hypothetical protein
MLSREIKIKRVKIYKLGKIIKTKTKEEIQVEN